MKLDKAIEPLPADSTLLRAAALGARPEVRRAHARAEGKAGARGRLDDPGAPGASAPPSRSTRSSTCSTRTTRVGQRELARRLRRRPRRPRPGPQHGDRGVRAAARRPRAGGAEPGSPRTRGSTASSRRSARAAERGRAGGRGAGGAVREPGHHVHRARRRRAAVPPGDDLRGPAHARRSRSTSSRSSGRSCATARPSSASCGPGVATLPHSAPILADAFEAGTDVLPKTTPMNRDLAGRVRRRSRTSSEDPLVRARDPTSSRGCPRRCSPTLALPHAGADHLQLRDALVPQRREPAVRGRLERHLAALHHRRAARPAQPTSRAEQRGRPVGGAGERARSARTTCTRTPTRTPPRRARRTSARRATSATRAGQTVDRQHARQPGHEDERPDGAAAMETRP